MEILQDTTMAKVLSRLDILLHANTANYVREMKKATDKTKQELKSVADYGKLAGNQLGMAFAGLGSLVSISHIVETADRMQDLASKVRINTQTTEEYNAVLHDLRKISTDYWTAIDGITDLYASSKRALDSLGASQRQVLDFTRNITMAMSVGGGSAQAQEAALIQLGQAMSMGVLRGQEFNSVSAQAPVIIDLLTDSLKVSRGELREMASDGKITSQIMMDAVLGGYDKLQDTINKMPTTFAQGVQNIKSQYDFLVDDIMNQNSLLSQNLANVALWTAENFRTLVGVGATLGAVWLANIAKNSALVTSFVGLTSATLANTKASIANAFSVQGQINAYNVLSTRLMLLRLTKAHYLDITKTAIATTTAYARSLVGLATSFNTATASARLHTLALAGVATAKRGAMGVGILVTRAVTGLGGAFVSLGRIITAHPIIALTAVIGAVIARTEGLSGAVKSLGDAFSVAGVLASDFIGGVVDGLGRAWTATANYLNSFMGGTNKAVSFSQTAFGGFFAGTQKGFVGVLQITARVFDLAGASVVTFTKYAWKNISSLGTAIANVFKGVGNFIVSVFEGVINNVVGKINFAIDGMNTISGMFGGGQIARLGQVSIGRMNYGSTDFGFGGFNASVAQNNAHYLENQVVNAYTQVQQSAKGANNANLGLAGSMADVASASEKAGAGAKKVADANKLAKKTADEASKALQELEDNFKSQLAEWERSHWDMGTPFVSELSKIEFEITSTSGKFHIASEAMQNDLRKLAREMDTAKANFDLFGTYTDATRQIKLLSSKGSQYQAMAYDLQDTGNALHLAGEEQKRLILTTLANLETATVAWELQDKIAQTQKELATLGTDGLARELLAIEQEKADTLKKYNHLLNDGYNDQFALIEQQANALEYQQKQVVITKQYNDLVQSLKTDEQKRLDTLKEQLTILAEQHRLSGADAMVERSRLLNNALGLPEQELDPFVKLEQENAHRLAVLDSFMATQQQLYQDNQNELARIEQEGAIARLAIDKHYQNAKNELMLTQSESLFGSMAQTAKTAFGEQSRAYRAIFALEKSMAIARSVMAIQTAMAQASANPFPMNLGAMATVASQVANIVGNIRAVAMPVGQAHDGIMSVPKSGTWNLEKGERVLPKHTAQNLDNTLSRLQAGGGQVVINQHITINTDGSHDVKDDSQNQMGQALKAGMLAVIQGEMRQGRSIYNFVKNGR